MTKKKAVICDIDGTIANHDGVRGHFDYEQVHLDKPHDDIIELIRLLYFDDYEILFVTGRMCNDSVLRKTTDWIFMKCPWLEPSDIWIFHREPEDYRKDFEIKKEIYDKKIKNFYDVKYCLDDRNQVVDMWRSIGLRCLQVAKGDF